MKAWGVHCAVVWCVCLTKPESQYCAVHAVKGNDYKPGDAPVTAACETCEGTTECLDCDGQGYHACEHWNCWEEHECPTCHGSGECRACQQTRPRITSFEERYLMFAFDPGWMPPPLFDRPWDAEEPR